MTFLYRCRGCSQVVTDDDIDFEIDEEIGEELGEEVAADQAWHAHAESGVYGLCDLIGYQKD